MLKDCLFEQSFPFCLHLLIFQSLLFFVFLSSFSVSCVSFNAALLFLSLKQQRSCWQERQSKRAEPDISALIVKHIENVKHIKHMLSLFRAPSIPIMQFNCKIVALLCLINVTGFPNSGCGKCTTLNYAENNGVLIFKERSLFNCVHFAQPLFPFLYQIKV